MHYRNAAFIIIIKYVDMMGLPLYQVISTRVIISHGI